MCSNCCLRKHWLKRPIWIRTGFVGRQSFYQIFLVLPILPWPSFPVRCANTARHLAGIPFALSVLPALARSASPQEGSAHPCSLTSAPLVFWHQQLSMARLLLPRASVLSMGPWGSGHDSHFDFLSGHQSTDSDVLGQKGIQEIALRNPVHFGAVQFTGFPFVLPDTTTWRIEQARSDAIQLANLQRAFIHNGLYHKTQGESPDRCCELCAQGAKMSSRDDLAKVTGQLRNVRVWSHLLIL